MVVAAGKVHGARAVHKVHPYRLDAFSSGENGPLAWVEEGRVRWSDRRPFVVDKALAPPSWLQAPSQTTAEPWVEVLMSMAGARPEGVRALVAAGINGLVVVATGNGTLHQALLPALKEAQAAGVWVWVVSRCPEGRCCQGRAPTVSVAARSVASQGAHSDAAGLVAWGAGRLGKRRGQRLRGPPSGDDWAATDGCLPLKE